MQSTRTGNPELRVFILAGGRSSRMGEDKSRLLLGSRTFIQRINSTALGLGYPVEFILDDEVPGCGPMGGIHTAFKRYRCGAGLFLSCDMPLVSLGLLREVVERFRAAGKPVFTAEEERIGFPFVLPRSARTVVQRLLKDERCSIKGLCADLGADLFSPNGDSQELLNVNTPADYQRLLRAWENRSDRSAVLDVRDLVIRRGQTHLVSGFSWRVRRGEHWVVLGPNGCGKTSLFAALLGYLTPTAGDVFVLGEEYGNSDWPQLRKQIGLVSSSLRQMMAESEPAWITVASGKYAMIDFWGTPKKSDRAAALRILREVEAEYLAERPWAVLSQGERQRVLIARALMAEPSLLILDEPCAGLDPAAREHFLHFLDRLGRRKDAPSLVLVTHHVEEIMPVFTHALIMKAGGKLAEGPIPRVLKSDLLSEAFGTAMALRKNGDRYSLQVRSNPRVII